MNYFTLSDRKLGTHRVYFDDKDYALVSKYTWRLAKGKRDILYARSPGKKSVRMHRIIMNAKEDEIIDHIDVNGLNNRRANLRKATNSQNLMNARLHLDSRTGFKGVTYKVNKRLYLVRIRVNYKLIYGGMYIDLLQAAQRYNELAIKYFGKFARLNQFTPSQQQLLSSDRIIYHRKNRNNVTGFRGVSFSNQNSINKYIATIRVNGRNVYLGSYLTPKNAATIYNQAAIKYNKPKEFLNVIPE